MSPRPRPVIKTMRELVDHGVTLVVASHDAAVLAAADHVLRLRDGWVALTAFEIGRCPQPLPRPCSP